MGNYGIKVSKPGYDVKTSSPQELVFSSKYQTLHVHSQGSGIVYDSTGRTVTVAHGLGYIPKFLVHTQVDSSLPVIGSTNYYYIVPATTTRGGIEPGQYDLDVRAWADSTNLYIKYGDSFGYKYYYTGNVNNNYGYEGVSYITGTIWNGYFSGTGAFYKSAVRFQDITISQGATIYKAILGYYLGSKVGSSDIKVSSYGIDEDNTADFGGAPWGRPLTTATANDAASGNFSTGDTWERGVTSQLQEIINRGGWSSGNPVGFIQLDNGTNNSSSNYIIDSNSSDAFYGNSLTYLKVLMVDLLANYKYTIFLDEMTG